MAEAHHREVGVGRCPLCVHAWAAGLFDGEGCITFYESTRRGGTKQWRLNLKITLKRPEPLRKMHTLYGGLLYTSVRKCGRTYQVWIVQSGAQAEVILKQWLPWLVEKRVQALVALDYCRFLSARKRGEVYSGKERARCSKWEKRLKALKHST